MYINIFSGASPIKLTIRRDDTSVESKRPMINDQERDDDDGDDDLSMINDLFKYAPCALIRTYINKANFLIIQKSTQIGDTSETIWLTLQTLSYNIKSWLL